MNRPIMLTDSELVRLSPATEHRRTVIGCEQTADWLGIWGFFEYGYAWVQHSAGDPPAISLQSEDIPPDCLAITIEGPGALTVSRGRVSLARLRDGRILLPLENPLQSVQTPLGRFFRQLIEELQYSHPASNPRHSVGKPLEPRSMLDVYTTSLLAILERIRLTRHGGCLMITRTPLDEQMAHIIYPVSDHVGLAEEVAAYKAIEDAFGSQNDHSDPVLDLEHCRREVDLHRTSRQLIRGINQISQLAAVDGAVVLNSRLCVQGFGVRFPVTLTPGTMVSDALTGQTYSCDNWGSSRFYERRFKFCYPMR